MSEQDGGPAFPRLDEAKKFENSHEGTEGFYFESVGGMSLRDWFATFAPEPSDELVKIEAELDRQRNPHGDSYKPPRRSAPEIRAQLRYRHADAMLQARKTPRAGAARGETHE